MRVYAGVERLRGIVAPLRTRPVLGSQVSRERGEGIEFADLRPLAPGDRARSINWRATARRRAPYVNLQHPEHSADLVLFLDTFAEADLAHEGTLDAVVRAAAALASTYLARRDRVALVSLGGELRWLTGSTGTRQLYRIVDVLFSSEVRPSFRWKGVAHVPRRLLPARALVIALSLPLLDERGISALLELRARGYDLVVLEISPVRGRAARRPRVPSLEASARRVALALETLGIPVAQWEPSRVGVELAIEEVIALRRHETSPSRESDYRDVGRGLLATLAAAATAESLVVATTAPLLLSLALLAGRAAPVAAALLLLGAIYVVPEGDRAIPAPIYGGALLLIAELAFWSFDERLPGRVEPGTATPRLLAILGVVVTGVAAGALVLLASESDVARSPARTAAGVGAILACIAVLTALARARNAPAPD